ncbi:MAG: DUF819 family protein [Promethearchaeia archaeon]
MHGVDGAWKIAAAVCSRHIGGAINYVAVSDVLQAPAATITAGIALRPLRRVSCMLCIRAWRKHSAPTHRHTPCRNRSGQFSGRGLLHHALCNREPDARRRWECCGT